MSVENNSVETKSMKSKWFKNEKLTNALIFAVGVILVLVGIVFGDSFGTQWSTVIISVGASVVASSAVSYITSVYLFKKKKLREVTEIWGLRSITENRSEMNAEVDKRLKDASKYLDVMAYGLKSFRETKEDVVKAKIQNGFKVRILTVNPCSEFLSYRDSVENKLKGSTANDIRQLVDWAESIEGNIEVRYCQFLPAELYFRVDGQIYVGHYAVGKESQRTITAEFVEDSKGFSYYADYFNSLWEKADKA